MYDGKFLSYVLHLTILAVVHTCIVVFYQNVKERYHIRYYHKAVGHLYNQLYNGYIDGAIKLMAKSIS